MAIERDKITGRNTTGHEWDGIKELDTPIPGSVKWSYGITIIIAIALIALYPAFPYFSGFTPGLLGYSSRAIVEQQVADAASERAERDKVLMASDINDLVTDSAVKEKYEAAAAILYRDNCAVCHQPDLQGKTGFPNLTDGHWLWSGNVEEIETTILYGINSGNDDERIAEMLDFGKQQMLERPEIKDVIEYIRSISGQEHNIKMSDRGDEIFTENCESCHGEQGVGGLESGAPSLVDSAWIYGSDGGALFKSIWSGRVGQMPAWEGRLSKADIRKLALYVKWQSHAGSQ